MRKITLFVCLVALCASAPALAQNAAPCSDERARQLDFWLGEWDLTWQGGEGTNEITRRFGDCVIEENFSGNMPAGLFIGHSVSVYSTALEQWRQTWVDSQGSYLVFTGGIGEDGVMRLRGESTLKPDGRTQDTRMSWLNVEGDSLDWHWEQSFDGGETWSMVWLIHYQRR